MIEKEAVVGIRLHKEEKPSEQETIIPDKVLTAIATGEAQDVKIIIKL